MKEGVGTMLQTLMTTAGQMLTFMGTVITNENVQPFLLVPAGIGVLGATVGLAKRVMRVGGRRR